MSRQRMTCAEATLRSMVDAGADRLFDMPGRGVYPLLNELPKFPKLEHVTAPHEFPLAAMADGYARIRGQASFLNLYMSTGVLNGASAIFVAARGALARLLEHPEIAEGIVWAAGGLFCFAINKVLFGIVNGMRRMRAFAIYTSLRYVLIAVALFVARGTGIATSHLAGIWTFVEGLMLIVLVVEVVATVRPRRPAGWTRWTREHLAYGVRGLPATLAYEINTKLDVWMLGAAGFTKEAVGMYSLAATINEGATQLSVVVQNNVNPMIASALVGGHRHEVEALITRTRTWFVPAFVAACAFGALVFPVLIPRVLGDPTLVEAAIPFAILMAGLAIASPYLPFTQILLMADRPGWHTVFMVLVVATNFTANIVLIPYLGLAGAATATTIAVITSAVLIRGLARGKVSVRC